MKKKSYHALACAAMSMGFALSPVVGHAAPEDATGESVATTVGDLALPDISSAPSDVVPVDEATPEQLTRVVPAPTPEEIAAAEAAAEKARKEEEARLERERREEEAREAAARAKAEADAKAQADANAVDAQIRAGEALPAAVEPAASDEETMPADEETTTAEAEAAPVDADTVPADAQTVPADGVTVPKGETQAASVAGEVAQKKDAKAEKKGDAVADRWAKIRPEEQRIADWINSLEGKTVVDVRIDGAGATTSVLAQAAVQSRPGDAFARARIEADRDAIYKVGYFYDIFPTFATVPEGVVITYHVLENPILKSVSISGNTVLKTAEIEKLVTVEPGKMLNTKTLHENIQAITGRYHKDGYILVKINDLDINREGHLTLKINEGILEGYTVKGNTKTKDRVVIREMRQKPGEPFNAKKARRGMQRVYNLGFFDDVNMKLNPGVEPNAVVLEIDVVEKRTGTFTIGAGYSTRDGLIGMVGIGDKNFRGTGDSFNVTFEFSGDDSDAHGFTFSYRRPWLDRKETSGTFRIYNRTYEYDDYDTNGDEIEEYMRKYTGGELVFSRPSSEYTTNFLTLRNREDRYIRHRSGKDRSNWKEWIDDNFGLTRSISVDHVTDTRDNVYSPTTGSRAAISAEFAGLGGDFNFQKITYDTTHYVKAGRSQSWAFRGAYGRGFGHMSEYGIFRIGGQNTLRGYRDDQFRDYNMVLGSIEYRFPVFSRVQGALFTDFGGTWESGWMPKHIKESIGFGLSVQTPVGPIRIDLAHGAQGNRVHFSVGGSF